MKTKDLNLSELQVVESGFEVINLDEFSDDVYGEGNGNCGCNIKQHEMFE